MILRPTIATALSVAVWPIPSLAQLPQIADLETIATRLEGIMDTAAQAKANPQKSHVQMTTCRLKPLPSEKPTLLLYQEQAIVPTLHQPYRQRFLELSISPYSRSVQVRSFKLARPSEWVNACMKTPKAPTVEDFGSGICSVYLRRSGDDYLGNTPVDGCPANVRGAVRITNHVVLRATGMETWDRGFDANGQQVWGARSDAYQFQKQSTPPSSSHP